MTRLTQFEDRFGSAGRALSRLIRPAFVAPKGRTLVWYDLSAIEARTLPWLANTAGAQRVLGIFEASDRDPDVPDIYMVEAAGIAKFDADEMWQRYRKKDAEAKNHRQTGKVPVLSLGFGGAVGALQNMAVNYGVSLTEAEARNVVDAWRANNKWARNFWDALWAAFLRAMENPGVSVEVGRVVYLFDQEYLSGTMMCFLPDGRPLMYPGLRWAKVTREDDEGNPYTRTELTYKRGHVRKSLWYGVLAENITQATAASLLRAAIAELAPAKPLRYGPAAPVSPLPEGSFVVAHTHDEIVVETDDDEDAVAQTRAALSAAFLRDRGWNAGLPLAAEGTESWYYTKVAD